MAVNPAKDKSSEPQIKKNDKWDIHSPAMNLTCNRTLCGTLWDMREVIKILKEETKNRNFDILSSLVEEIQVYANRMESALSDFKTSKELKEEYKSMKKELELLYEEKPHLKDDK